MSRRPPCKELIEHGRHRFVRHGKGMSRGQLVRIRRCVCCGAIKKERIR